MFRISAGWWGPEDVAATQLFASDSASHRFRHDALGVHSLSLERETSTDVLASFSRELANAKRELAKSKRKLAEIKQKLAVLIQ